MENSSNKVTVNDDGVNFNCQHGRLECAGNKAHSCGLFLAGDEMTAVKFVSCAMESRKYEEVVELLILRRSTLLIHIRYIFMQCVKKTGLDFEKYQSCYSSEMGTLLQIEAAMKTDKLPKRWLTGRIAFVPTIVYNDVTSFHIQNKLKTLKSHKEFKITNKQSICFQKYVKSKSDKSRRLFVDVLCDEIKASGDATSMCK